MKRNYWPLFFIGIFSFVFSMIIWTVSKAIKAPVIEDRSFLLKYQDVDENYNKLMEANEEFLSKYNLSFILNDKDFGLTTEDIKYGQRVIEKYSNHKDTLKIGNNTLKVVATSKDSNEKQDINIDLVITKTMTNDNDVVLKQDKFENVNNDFISEFEISQETNWNITGSFKVNDSIGYIFIKTNAR
ncbi:hypothetical protein [Aliarcobacter vitoriensis]|uniref:Cytochrome c oxidase-associated protein CcoH n=1 Tax=Aliarcobacter vitoriensis TaxID=2011099 RepID=A0A366MTF0_9BACT|nr:hypothetical protein [Aliarcobacter vitoriensis]RBQ28874.1 hypothetical protein CRU91_06780 [Aliarcobacter vitoriensis]